MKNYILYYPLSVIILLCINACQTSTQFNYNCWGWESTYSSCGKNFSPSSTSSCSMSLKYGILTIDTSRVVAFVGDRVVISESFWNNTDSTINLIEHDWGERSMSEQIFDENSKTYIWKNIPDTPYENPFNVYIDDASISSHPVIQAGIFVDSKHVLFFDKVLILRKKGIYRIEYLFDNRDPVYRYIEILPKTEVDQIMLKDEKKEEDRDENDSYYSSNRRALLYNFDIGWYRFYLNGIISVDTNRIVTFVNNNVVIKESFKNVTDTSFNLKENDWGKRSMSEQIFDKNLKTYIWKNIPDAPYENPFIGFLADSKMMSKKDENRKLAGPKTILRFDTIISFKKEGIYRIEYLFDNKDPVYRYIKIVQPQKILIKNENILNVTQNL